jgi:VanZ family protein
VEDVTRARLRHLWTWLPLLAYAGGIVVLSSQPAKKLPPVFFPGADKLVHMALYALLGGLAARAAHRAGLGRRAGLLLVACIAFGLFDEWYQQLTPGRSSDLLDALADAMGASTGFFLVLRYHRARHVPRHSTLR